MQRETNGFLFFFPGVAKLRICAFGTVSTYLPWQHGGNPSRAGKNKINTQRGAEGALLASYKTLDPAVHDGGAAHGLPS
jgi:hypothetical protein